MLDIIRTPEFGQFVVNVLLALVAVLVPLIGTAVRGFVNSQKANTNFQTLANIARMAVLAAEQAGLAGVVTDKKASAIAAAQAMLADRGLKVDLTALDAAIEAAVASEFNYSSISRSNLIKAEERFPYPTPDADVPGEAAA